MNPKQDKYNDKHNKYIIIKLLKTKDENFESNKRKMTK